MPFDFEKTTQLLEKKLQAMSGSAALPEMLLRLASETYRQQMEARRAVQVQLSATMLAEKERNLQGAPLLAREEFPVDMPQALALFERLGQLASECGPQLASSVERLNAMAASGELDVKHAIGRALAGDEAYFQAMGEQTPEAPRTLRFLIQASLAPQLAAVGEAAYAHFPKDRTWNFGHCPVCASPPLLARMINREGARGLTCSFCQVEYRAKRLLCPYCGEEDPERLDLFTADELPGFAVQVCSQCNSYLKTVDFRDYDRPSLPVLDDLESLALDMIAQQRGHVRPVPSAWGF
ncbi:formate dehydrogenase accessory protein FdhE [Megalodesulfovibrio paquesii]